MKKITTTLVFAGIFALTVRGQDFLNLNFESAYSLPGNPGENGMLVPSTEALPDWSAYSDGDALFNVYYASNYFSGTEASVGLEGGDVALSGSFSAALYVNGSISQTGLVPGDAESLQFEGEGPASANLYVTLGGQNLSYSVLSVLPQGPDYYLLGVNIPAGMAGQMETLAFGCQGVGSGNVLLDDIEFSTSSVPEPGEGVLIGIGAVLVWIFRRRRRTRNVSSANFAN